MARLSRRQLITWIVVGVIAMAAWAVLMLGFRALIMDPACGGVACDRMREESTNLRAMLLVACVAGELVGGAIVGWLAVSLRRG